MPAITSGNSATFAVQPNQAVLIQARNCWARFENPTGTKVDEFNGRKQFLMTAAQNVTITNVSGAGDLYYDLLDAVTPTTTVTASRALNSADNGQTLRVASSSQVTLTAPSGLPAGFSCAIVQVGTGKATVAAGSGVTINSSGSLLSTSGQYATVGLIQTATNEYVLSGSTGS